jgi:hypothetical protein
MACESIKMIKKKGKRKKKVLPAMQAVMEVDGVFSGNYLLLPPLGLLHHFHSPFSSNGLPATSHSVTLVTLYFLQQPKFH